MKSLDHVNIDNKDRNMSIENSHFQSLTQMYDLSLLIKEPTCFQSHNLTCIDKFLTNQKVMFRLNRLFKIRLSDHHHKLISVDMSMKPGIFCEAPQKKVYISYKNFDLEHFNIALKSEGYNEFGMTFCSVLNKHAPIKVKILKHNNNPFLTQNLRKAIMHRSKFKNRFNKYRTYENWCNYKTQQNYCKLLKENKTTTF